jgi:hypothetical protein
MVSYFAAVPKKVRRPWIPIVIKKTSNTRISTDPSRPPKYALGLSDCLARLDRKVAKHRPQRPAGLELPTLRSRVAHITAALHYLMATHGLKFQLVQGSSSTGHDNGGRGLPGAPPTRFLHMYSFNGEYDHFHSPLNEKKPFCAGDSTPAFPAKPVNTRVLFL